MKSTHKENVEKLRSLESELIDLIAKTGETEIMDKFIEWQEKRTDCAVSYMNELKQLV